MPNKKKKTLAHAGKRMKKTIAALVKNVPLTPDELELLREAIDSHIYWQLAGVSYRNNGFVDDPGSDYPEDVEKIKEAEALLRKLGGTRG